MTLVHFEQSMKASAYSEFSDAASRLNRQLENPPVPIDAQMLMNLILSAYDADAIVNRCLLALHVANLLEPPTLPNPALPVEIAAKS